MKTKLSKILFDKGWTEMELSRRTGIAQSYINRVKNARVMPTVRTAIRICRALDVAVEEAFLDEEGYAQVLQPAAGTRHFETLQLRLEAGAELHLVQLTTGGAATRSTALLWPRKEAACAQLAPTVHNATERSREEDASMRPLGEKDTDSTSPACAPSKRSVGHSRKEDAAGAADGVQR